MPIGLSGLFKRWIMSIDRVILSTSLALLAVGIWVSIASTPAVAMKLGLAPFHFVKQHILIAPIAVFIMVFISFLQVRHIRRLALIGYFICIGLIICTLIFGIEIKGARRWLSIFGFSLQASEFLKPTIAILTAWLISEQYRDRQFPGIALSTVCIALVVPLLLFQPDVGMTVVLVLTWFSQLFISGLSIFMIISFVLASIGAMIGLYFILPHFATRIDKFLLQSDVDTDLYQIQKSIEAFKSGGLWGKGPGEGVVKTLLPDSHSDFVFSVIGEEFGFIVCLLIISLFIILITRSISQIIKSSGLFNFIAVFGILFQITLQVLVNICTSLNLIPTKGMTLPFISYGGSSMLATAVSLGVVLAITKKNVLNSNSL